VGGQAPHGLEFDELGTTDVKNLRPAGVDDLSLYTAILHMDVSVKQILWSCLVEKVIEDLKSMMREVIKVAIAAGWCVSYQYIDAACKL
jgi:hypothetical protein